MRILVTGGAGYIGSHTAKQLAREGHEPVVLDNLSTGHRWAIRWGPLIEGDLADTGLVRQVLREYRIEGVLHFAASAYVGESMINPRAYFRNNVAGSLSLLDAMLESNVRRIVFSSSCATYGVPESLPIREDQRQLPTNPYGESKLFVERILRWYGEAYGLQWAALRYFNAAGADLDGELGEEHDPETHLIPRAIYAALGLLPHLSVYGTDYPTPDGTAVRDYIHVTDLAQAHLRALLHLQQGGSGLALNLGTGVGVSVRDIVQTVQAITGRVVPVINEPRRAGDPPELVASSGQAKRVLGWQPHYTDVRVMVESAWRWFEAPSLHAAVAAR